MNAVEQKDIVDDEKPKEMEKEIGGRGNFECRHLAARVDHTRGFVVLNPRILDFYSSEFASYFKSSQLDINFLLYPHG